MKIQPSKYHGTENLMKDTLLELSEFLKTKLNFEKRASQHNFDSGIPIEDFFRESLSGLLPQKYSATNGTIIDKDNNTCGDCDVILFDSFSFPILKSPATKESRRKFLPFESVFGIIEIKQTLNLGALDDKGNLKKDANTNLVTACEKIAQFKALSRKTIDDDFIKPGFIARGSKNINRPFGYILCLDGPDDRDAVQKEIRRINEKIPKELRVDGVFILDKYAFTWLYSANAEKIFKGELQNEPKNIDSKEVYPENSNGNAIIFSEQDTLYYMFTKLWNELSNRKLGSPDFYNDYGGKDSLNKLGNSFFPQQREV